MGGGPRETERTGLLASASEKELELRQRVVPISGGDDMEDGKKVLSGGSSGGASEKGASEKAPDYSLGLVFAGFVLTSLGNRLFQKLQTIPMYNYPITVNLSSTIMYVPVCFCYIIPAIMCMDPSPISPEERAIPKLKFAVMGGFDCVSSIMQILAVNFVPNASTLARPRVAPQGDCPL